MPALVVRLLLSGDVQESPFQAALAARLARRAATLRPVGAGLEVRIAGPARAAPAKALAGAKSIVQQAARASRTQVGAVSWSVEEDTALPNGVHSLRASLGSSDAHKATPAPRADLAPCEACKDEAAADGRRSHFLRTECLACGPRYAHAVGFPLTRAGFGLAGLPPCAACEREAADPRSRRFASERIACNECGPTPTFQEGSGAPFTKGPLRRAAARLNGGEVIAAQTPYGFLALCSLEHVPRLRVAVGNEFVSLGVVAASARQVRRVADPTARELRALFSPEAPELVFPARESRSAPARELSVFGAGLRVRAPDSMALFLLAAEAGPLVWAPATRGGARLPSSPSEAGGLSTASWLEDGPVQGDPVPPHCGFFVGPRFVLLAHGRGSLPCHVAAGHGRTVLAFGGGSELSGAAAFGGQAYLTAPAGPASRADSADRLRRLLSRAAALSPAHAAEAIDLVVASPDEGTPARMAAEDAAADAGCPFVVVASTAARAAAAQLGGRRPPRAALVLTADEPAGEGDAWLEAPRTGGELIDAASRKVLGGLAPYEVVESPGGRPDLLAPLASAFERAGIPLPNATRDDAPILELLRARAERATSFVLVVDAVACALGLAPRRAPTGAGLAEVAPYLGRPAFSRRHPLAPALVRARGAKQVDVAALLRDLSSEWSAAARREGRGLSWERRAALAASFARALVQGAANSARAALPRGARVAVTGTAFAEPAVMAAAFEHLKVAGLSPDLAPGVPLLDGAVAIGQVRLAKAA